MSCPNCGSERIDTISEDKRSIIAPQIKTESVNIIPVMRFGSVTHLNRCLACGEIWDPKLQFELENKQEKAKKKALEEAAKRELKEKEEVAKRELKEKKEAAKRELEAAEREANVNFNPLFHPSLVILYLPMAYIWLNYEYESTGKSISELFKAHITLTSNSSLSTMGFWVLLYANLICIIFIYRKMRGKDIRGFSPEIFLYLSVFMYWVFKLEASHFDKAHMGTILYRHLTFSDQHWYMSLLFYACLFIAAKNLLNLITEDLEYGDPQKILKSRKKQAGKIKK